MQLSIMLTDDDVVWRKHKSLHKKLITLLGGAYGILEADRKGIGYVWKLVFDHWWKITSMTSRFLRLLVNLQFYVVAAIYVGLLLNVVTNIVLF